MSAIIWVRCDLRTCPHNALDSCGHHCRPAVVQGHTHCAQLIQVTGDRHPKDLDQVPTLELTVGLSKARVREPSWNLGPPEKVPPRKSAFKMFSFIGVPRMTIFGEQ